MEWAELIGEAIRYIEQHITEELTVEKVAQAVNFSPYYFQKGFSMLCGYTLGEYIRNRRLTLAGKDLAAGSEKVIDIALRYGYDSPDSFTKAFTRFHGVTPAAARREPVLLKYFAAFKIKLSLEGGYLMDYRIEQKEAFTVLGNEKTFRYENAQQSIPQFWQEHFAQGKGQTVKGE
ncbi:MAG: helix-turn-helix domain-containing protein, partial [Acutalibacteraceae bacterium]